MILVVGSTGMVGSETCRRLIKEGEAVRALVRPTSDPAKVTALREAGAEIVVGDLRDRETLDVACRGIRTVVCTVSAMPHAYEAGVNDIRTTDLLGVLELIARPDHLWIDDVAIDPAWQGRGLGRLLLGFAEDEARRLGLPALGLLTNERYVANIAMYERHGYRETHREPYRGTDLVHFRKTFGR